MTRLDRVIGEKRELDERIARLDEHMALPEFRTYELLEQDLMGRQAGFMRAYSTTLGERIDILEGKKKDMATV